MSEVSLEEVTQEAASGWRALLRGFATLAFGELGARVFGFVAVTAMARRIGPEGFGLIALGNSLLAWVALVSDSGTEILNVREVARQPQQFRKIADALLGLRLVLSVGAMAVLAVSVVIASSEASDRQTLWLFSLALPAIALNLRWIVVGVGASRAVAAGNIASQVLMASCVLLFIHERHNTLRVPIIQAAAELAYALVVIAAVAPRFGIPRPRVDIPAWKATLRAGLPLMINGLARASIYSFDIVAIAIIVNRGQVGIYSAASKPALLPLSLIGLFSVSFLSSYSAATGADAADIFRKTIKGAVALTIPAAIALSASATLILPLLFGRAFSPGATTLAILAWRIPLAAIASPYGFALIARDHQRALMRNNVIVAIFNAAIGVVAIAYFGIVGAGLIALASQLLALVLNYRTAVPLGVAPGLREALGLSRSRAR